MVVSRMTFWGKANILFFMSIYNMVPFCTLSPTCTPLLFYPNHSLQLYFCKIVTHILVIHTFIYFFLFCIEKEEIQCVVYGTVIWDPILSNFLRKSIRRPTAKEPDWSASNIMSRCPQTKQAYKNHIQAIKRTWTTDRGKGMLILLEFLLISNIVDNMFSFSPPATKIAANLALNVLKHSAKFQGRIILASRYTNVKVR